MVVKKPTAGAARRRRRSVLRNPGGVPGCFILCNCLFVDTAIDLYAMVSRENASGSATLYPNLGHYSCYKRKYMRFIITTGVTGGRLPSVDHVTCLQCFFSF